MRLLVGNYDFEHQLADGPARTLSAILSRINSELAHCMAAVAVEGDVVWAPEPCEPAYAEHLHAAGFSAVRFISHVKDLPPAGELCPWGWSTSVVDWGRKLGWRCSAPDLAAVAEVNARRFSFGLEREWNVGLPHAREVRTLREFQSAIEEISVAASGWITKANFGMSARERILGQGNAVSASDSAWVKRRIAAGSPI